ncbi:MAG: type II toxin-antitoxin system YafQ family toxin [Oscillospiraceae bacterium]|jgi:mRNA interferase YafQ|nr:type II toxin-antitoxin system YafQ family toxin [Oscillospiraceae bacterium]
MTIVKDTHSWKRDLKRAVKRGLDVELVVEFLHDLENSPPLPAKYKAHKLVNANLIDCHIQGDWLVLYEPGEGTATLRRTGTHSDLLE